MTPAAYILSLPVRAYRLVLSPYLGNGCRYQPTCSVYALEALARHGALKGGSLAVSRICRCHPWGGHGYDPVPGADLGHDATTDLSAQNPHSQPPLGPEAAAKRCETVLTKR